MMLFRSRMICVPFCLGVLWMIGWMASVTAQEAPQSTVTPEDAYFQPVRIIAPEGVMIAPAVEGNFLAPMPAPQIFAFRVGDAYRFKVTNIPLRPGVELFPTLEIIDRTHPPMGEELRHAVLVELAKEDLYTAIQGKYVTRVIYIEDPNTAMPVAQTNLHGQGFFDVPAEANAYEVAKTLGRPIAILRIGARMPEVDEIDMDFLFQCPPFLHYPPAE